MPPVTLQGYIVVPEGDLDNVLEELPNHITLTRQEPGCQDFMVKQDLNNPKRFQVYEIFADRKTFQAHQQRVSRSKWGRVTANAERHYDIQEIG